MKDYEFIKEKIRRHEQLTPEQFKIAMLGNAAYLLYKHADWQSVTVNSVIQWIACEIGVEDHSELEWLYGGW